MKSSTPFSIISLLASLMLTTSIATAQQAKANQREILDQQLLQTNHAALEIINQWRTDTPEKGERTLKIIYWSPNDRQPQPDHKKRLNDILLDIQKFYAKEMDRHGFGKLTIKFDKTAQDQIDIIEVTGKHPYTHYQVNSGNEILTESTEELKKRQIDVHNETIVIFCNMSNWDADKKIITQNSPYYARGSSLSGAAWQVDSAILKLEDLTNKTDHVKDGQYGNITLGKYNTIFIGGIAHELGHAFGLPHNMERHDEYFAYGIALMGSGNRAYGNERRKEGRPTFLTQASALKLASHPMFSGVTKEMKTNVQFGYQDLKYSVDNNNNATFKGKINSTIPCYAVIAAVDPEGGSNYDATTHIAIPDKDGNFVIQIPNNTFKRKSSKGNVHIISYFANGRATSNNGTSTKGLIPYYFSDTKKLQFGPPKF